VNLKQTPSQTVGPFFAYGLTPEQYGYALRSIAGPDMETGDARGDVIRIIGQVFDGDGVAIPDAMVEIWQADPTGRYDHPADPRRSNTGFSGFARAGTGADPDSRFVFRTMKPGSIGPGHAPHINVVVFMRGLLSHAYTRIYFSDEAEANATDPVLAAVPDDRRATLLAQLTGNSDAVVYRFDIHMQGDDETVFFDI
jgi:protocatechuate 3,4-dioxygenase, alpha subunit